MRNTERHVGGGGLEDSGLRPSPAKGGSWEVA